MTRDLGLSDFVVLRIFLRFSSTENFSRKGARPVATDVAATDSLPGRFIRNASARYERLETWVRSAEESVDLL